MVYILGTYIMLNVVITMAYLINPQNEDTVVVGILTTLALIIFGVPLLLLIKILEKIIC